MKRLKDKFLELTVKELVSYFLATGSMIAGFLLIFLGMYLPPEGEIHHSVLTAFGMAGIFSGSLLGISMHYSAELENIRKEVLRR